MQLFHANLLISVNRKPIYVPNILPRQQITDSTDEGNLAPDVKMSVWLMEQEQEPRRTLDSALTTG